MSQDLAEMGLDWKDAKSVPEIVPSAGLSSPSVPEGTGGTSNPNPITLNLNLDQGQMSGEGKCPVKFFFDLRLFGPT